MNRCQTTFIFNSLNNNVLYIFYITAAQTLWNTLYLDI